MAKVRSTERELPLANQLIYASGSFGGNILGRTSQLWLLYFYAPPEDADLPKLAPVALIGVLLFAGKIIEALDDPLIGYWSDRTRSRWGRRIPFVVLATPFYALFFVLLWLPPFDHETAVNALYLFAVIEIYHLFSTLSGGPFESLLPEIAPLPKERLTIVTWQVVFGSLGAGVGLVATGPMIELIGFWPMAAVVATLAVISRFYALSGAWRAIRIEEPPAAIGVRQAVRRTLENDQFRAFLPTFVLYSVGIGILVGVLPFYVKEILGREEGEVAYFTFAALAVLLLCLPAVYRLAMRKGKAWVYSAAMLIGACYLPFVSLAGLLPVVPPFAQALVLIGLVGIPMSAVQAFPNAIMADVIDYDAVRTGMRREAVYYGTQAFVEKTVTSLSPLVLAMLLLLGSTSENQLGIRLAGPIAALFVLAGYFSFRAYRLPDSVTPETVGQLPAGTGARAD